MAAKPGTVVQPGGNAENQAIASEMVTTTDLARLSTTESASAADSTAQQPRKPSDISLQQSVSPSVRSKKSILKKSSATPSAKSRSSASSNGSITLSPQIQKSGDLDSPTKKSTVTFAETPRSSIKRPRWSHLRKTSNTLPASTEIPEYLHGRPDFDKNPRQMICMYCSQDIETIVEYENGRTACVCFLVLCFVGSCILPCLLKSCKDAVHYCPTCKRELGSSKPCC